MISCWICKSLIDQAVRYVILDLCCIDIRQVTKEKSFVASDTDGEISCFAKHGTFAVDKQKPTIVGANTYAKLVVRIRKMVTVNTYDFPFLHRSPRIRCLL